MRKVKWNFSKQKWAYLAGVFDGEGSVFLRRSNRLKYGAKGYSYAMGVTVVCGTDYHFVTKIMRWFNKNRFETSKYAKSNKKPGYRFRLYAREALNFLENVYPFLICKKERAKLAIKFQKNKKRKPFLTPKERGNEEGQFQHLKKLNKRGV